MTYGVSFFARKERTKVKTGKASLYCHITVNGKPADFSLQKNVNKAVLKIVRGKSRSSNQRVVSLRDFLDKVGRTIGNYYNELKLQQLPITAELLKLKFLGLEQNSWPPAMPRAFKFYRG